MKLIPKLVEDTWGEWALDDVETDNSCSLTWMPLVALVILVLVILINIWRWLT